MKSLFVLIVLCVAVWLGGCGPGLADTEHQRKLRHKHIADVGSRQFVDDWDHFWLMDRPSRLTYWHVRDRD